ncbi:MAG: helix-turn-helix transcriptional regulator [Planctomycetota bacterium]
MQFGQRIRQLRDALDITQKELARRLGVSQSYVNKVENSKLAFGDFPSEKFIHKLADELDADEDELLILADKIPSSMRQRIRQDPEAFRRLAALDRESLQALVERIDDENE